MNLERLTRPRDETPNVLDPELPEWASGDKKLYIAGEAVRAMAQNLIDEIHEHRHLRSARIVIVMRTGMKAGADGRVRLGSARKSSPLMALLSRSADFLLELNAGAFKRAPKAAKAALLDHELSHCSVATKMQMVSPVGLDSFVERLGIRHVATNRDMADSDGQIPVISMKQDGKRLAYAARKHDVECFVDVVARWGAWLPQYRRLADAIADAQAPDSSANLFDPAEEEETAEAT